jgi:hypothetical protein
MRRTELSSLPFWPRFLSREEAARYVGVSPETFDAERRAGLWPGPRHRHRRFRGPDSAGRGKLTWDRHALDRAADAMEGSVDGLTDEAARRQVEEAVSATIKNGWIKRLPKKARGRIDR